MARRNDPARPKEGTIPSLAAEAFHGLAGEVVRAIEPHTEASTGALLVQFLVAFGFVVGRCAFYLADGARHYPNLFAVIVGDTAKSRKGTSWNRLRTIFESVAGWPSERVMTGLSSGEGLIEQVSDSHADTRLLVVQTEFGAVLQVLARSGNTLSPVLRDAWDGTDLRIMTKNQPAAASGEHVAMVAHITSDELLARLERTDLWNGFANRFLWCFASRARLLPHGGDLKNSAIRPLLQSLNDTVKWASRLKGKQIKWDSVAADEWTRVYGRLARTTPGMIGAVTSRAEAHVVRLALIYSLLDKSVEIRTEHLSAALAVWRFCESSARQVFGQSLGNPTADRIRTALTQTGHGMTRTEISSLFKHHQSSDDISRALDLLRKLEMAECRREKSAGRSIERWFTIEK